MLCLFKCVVSLLIRELIGENDREISGKQRDVPELLPEQITIVDYTKLTQFTNAQHSGPAGETDVKFYTHRTTQNEISR